MRAPDNAPSSGPATSSAAARAIKPAARRLEDRVLLALLEAAGLGLTDEEGQTATGLPGDTYRPRRWTLARQGLIMQAGRRKTRSGRSADVWITSDAGMRKARELLDDAADG